MNEEFMTALRRRTASTSVGPSTARNMGPKGTVKSAREFLASLDLNKFNKQAQSEFLKSLNKATRTFQKKLPDGARNWGAARKFLNIFLRGVVYNKFLCKKYKLSLIEPWLEVPLDRQVAMRLRAEDGGKTLPYWKTVIGLDYRTSQKYQKFASEIAKKKNVSRVHLDLIYWRGDFTAPGI